MKVEEFDYELPEELIAQKPAPVRDESRLMCLNKETGEIKEAIFKEIIEFLEPGDLLIRNNSRVIPARLYGEKVPAGTEIEFLLLHEREEDIWEVLVRPGKRVKKGNIVKFGAGKLTAEIIDYTDFGGRIVEFKYDGNFEEILQELGEMPLPPYINRKLEEPERYQTVYASKKGSAAAPTAGLHFTPELLNAIKEKGIKIASVTLHVGLGTFRPVHTEDIEEHEMHAEYYEIAPEVAEMIKDTKKAGKRVIAIGTTVTRTLESAATDRNKIEASRGWTDIFIYPDYEFKIIDALITNFHLPKSTLIMMISAFAGKEKIMKAYQVAVEKGYRFFSLGDAMYIY